VSPPIGKEGVSRAFRQVRATFTIASSLGEAVGELQLEVAPGFPGEPAIFTGQV
jgi:hypothetical protein